MLENPPPMHAPPASHPAHPDRVLLVGRDGSVLREEGTTYATLTPPDQSLVDATFRRIAQRAIKTRQAIETTLAIAGGSLQLRASPLGPDRALCVLRAGGAASGDDAPSSWLARPAFVSRLQEAIDDAQLREVTLGVATIELDGLAQVARIFDNDVARQVFDAALRRSAEFIRGDDPGTTFGGVIGATTLGLTMPCTDRHELLAAVSRVLTALSEPVQIGDAQFQLSPYAGIAELGRDGRVSSSLLAQARHAAAEALATASRTPLFASSAAPKSRAPTSDVARELQTAIRDGSIRLRYLPRHDLESGRRVAWVGYLRWQHPLRGEISATECLSIAEATGLSKALSKALLASVARDCTALLADEPDDVRLSLGALRHHVLDEAFVEDIADLTASPRLQATRLELRISERTFVATDTGTLRTFADAGIQLIVDEVGRALLPLDRLARAPLFGMQLDRAWAVAASSDAVARRVSEAAIGVARALGLIAIASGIDDEAQRATLLALGCQHGIGDLYAGTAAEPRIAAQSVNRSI